MILSKKLLITLSIVGIFVVAAVMVLVLQLINGKAEDTSLLDTVPQPGESVALIDTPDLKACSTVPITTIKEVLGSDASALSEGKREGIIAHNRQKADSCVYTYTVKGTEARLAIQAYPFVEGDATATSNTFDTTWLNINRVQFPDYTLRDPAYFKKVRQDERTFFILQVVTGPRHYHFEISQGAESSPYSEELAIKTLIGLAMNANYGAADGQTTPDTSVTSPSNDELTPPEVTDENYPGDSVQTAQPGEPTI